MSSLLRLNEMCKLAFLSSDLDWCDSCSILVEQEQGPLVRRLRRQHRLAQLVSGGCVNTLEIWYSVSIMSRSISIVFGGFVSALWPLPLTALPGCLGHLVQHQVWFFTCLELKGLIAMLTGYNADLPTVCYFEFKFGLGFVLIS